MGNRERIRLGNKEAAHLYEVVIQNPNEFAGARQLTIEVDADTSTQAGKIARDNGYTVRSVNLVG